MSWGWALTPSRTLASSPSTSTTKLACAASGTSGAAPSLTKPTVPVASPEATPGSHLACCSSLPA